MPHDGSTQEVADLALDAAALNEAFLSGDLLESRFRAGLIAGSALAHGLTGIHKAALAVVNRLGNSGDSPKNGCAKAMQDLSVELDDAMMRLP